MLASPSITIKPVKNRHVLVIVTSLDGQEAALTRECGNDARQGEHPGRKLPDA